MTTDPQPTRAFEIERKYDVDAATPLPDWTTIPEVARVGPLQIRALDASYFDTPERSLAHAGVAVRRRTGGSDEGWHIKGPRDGDGRLELTWPLGEGNHIPPAVIDELAQWAAPPFTPLARIRNNRRAYDLIDSHGDVLAEFVDDHVTATDLREGVQRSWREWEVELGPAAPRVPTARESFFAAIERAVIAAGGRFSASDSKLARALGF